MFEHSHPVYTFDLDPGVFIEYLVYSSIYLSFAAGAMAFISSVLHHVAFNPVVLALGMLITFSVYNLNRKTDESEDAINHSHRFAFTKRYEHLLFASAIGAYVLALVLSGLYGLSVLLISAIPLISGLIYSTPIFPKGCKYRRLKEIPLAKSLIVAIAWALPPALLPVYIGGAIPSLITLAVVLFFFSLVFINTVLFDIRDVEGDRATGVRTIPVCIGVTNTKILLTLINIIFGVGIIVLLEFQIPMLFLCLFLFGMIYAQAYILLYQKISTGNLKCDLIADGQFIVLGVLMVGIVFIQNSIQILLV